MSKNTDHYTDLEYIREKFRSDGIKAPDSLSEENIFAMLPDLDEVQKQTDSDGQPHDAGKSKDPSDAFTQVKAKKRPAVRKWMAVAACTLIALLGVSQVYNAVTAPPDTSLVNGELYTFGSKTIYEYLVAPEVRAGYFVMDKDYTEGDYYPCPRMGGKTTLFQVNTSLMIQYTFATAGLGTLLLHASVTRYAGRGNLFFGVSGTGKSTHSRLWHEYVPGSDLMNDDNPVIRYEDGRFLVYGSPWSGKTLCYRNVVQAYASVIAAVSTIRWNHDIMSLLIPTIERVAMTVPCFQLRCRPDEEAVQVCKQAILP